MSTVKFVHTNILARDWKALSDFYIDVFGCTKLPPKRDLSGVWIEKMTNIPSVHIEGIHLLLPGYENGPTLEIFSYNYPLEKNLPPQINETGFTHITFHVDDMEKYIQRVLHYGGSFYGEVTKNKIKDVGDLTAVYMRDPEGNIIELQNWKK